MRLLTVANGITFFRLLLLIPFFVLVFRENFFFAGIIFVLAISLDLVDGFAAKLLKQKTVFGDYFDSVVDVLLIFIPLFILFFSGLLSSFVFFALIFNRLLALGPALYSYIKKKKSYKPLHIRVSVLVAYALVACVLFSPKYGEIVVFALLAVMYALVLSSYVHLFRSRLS